MKKVLTYYLRPYYFRMFGGFLIKFLGTIMDLLIPWVLAYIIDYVVPTGSLKKVFLWGGAMFLFAVCAVLGNIFANRFASKVAELAMRTIRKDLFEKVIYLSNGKLNAYTESSLVSRLTSDSYNVHNAIGMMQRLGVRAPILLLGGIMVTMTLDVYLAMILVFMLPFLGCIVFLVSKKGIPLYESQQGAADRMLRKLRENITGIRVIRALSKSAYERESFDKYNREVVHREKKASIIMGITNPAMNFILNMGWVLVILAGAVRVHSGSMESGKIVAFLTYFTIILNAMMSITKLFIKFSQAASSAGRMMQVIEECTDMDMVEALYGQSSGFIEFRNVSFSYHKGKPVLKNVSFSLKKGESLGIIGSTGAGKTTLIQLLMRFYEPDEGEIYVDGQNIASMERGRLREYFGTVFQNDTLFEDTVYENISLYRDIEEKEVEKAAEYACIAEHIRQMKGEYKAGVAIKGANLSGGQKQRMLIARALAGAPEILLLDDASSALDYKTDAAIRGSIARYFSKTTLLIIAQRISSVMNCDKILLLENGEVAGIGTHQELMKNCKEYRDIEKIQLEA